MFKHELKDLLTEDQARIERMLERAVREMLNSLEVAGSPDLLQKCANIRAVFKLVSELRADRANQ